jgi:MFS family permease
MKYNLLTENTNFRRLFGAGVCSNFADGLMLVALPWLATLMTSDPLLISLVFASNRLPWLLLSIPASVLADAFDRRLLVGRMDIFRAMAMCIIFILTLLAINQNSIYYLIGLAFLIGCAEVVRDNTAQSFLPNIVAADDLETANSQLWSAEKLLGEFIGPPLAGLLIAHMLFMPFGLYVMLMFLSAYFIFRIQIPKIADTSISFKSALIEGISYVRNDRTLFRLAIVLSVANFFASGMVAIQVMFAQEVLHATAIQYGMIVSAGAFGAVLGSFVAPKVIKWAGPNLCLRICVSVWVIGYTLIGISTSVWGMATALSLVLMSGMIWNVTTVSWRQKRIPPSILGRANSIFRFFGWGSIPIGAAFFGAFVKVSSDHMTKESALTIPFYISAVGCVLILNYITVRLRLDE